MWTLVIFVIGISGQMNKTPDVVVHNLSNQECARQQETIMVSRHDAIAVCQKEPS